MNTKLNVYVLAFCLSIFGFANFVNAQTGSFTLTSGADPSVKGNWSPTVTSFITGNQTFIIQGSATMAANWVVNGAGNVVQVPSGAHLTINTGKVLTGTVSVANTATLTIASKSSTTQPVFGTLSSGSTVEYTETTNAQTVLGASYYNLTLSGGTKTLVGTTANTNVSNIFNIGSTLTLSTDNTLTTSFNGTITGAGTITGGANCNLTIGSSTTNTLNFTAASDLLNNFTLNGSGQTVVLGSSLTKLTIEGAFTQTNGNLNLNGDQLILDATSTATFPASASNGVITGSSASSMSVAATSISGSLFMDQTTPGTTNELTALVLNCAGQTLTLGNSLSCVAFTQTNGIVDINGQTLSISGATTFPAASTNGTISGSSSSNLSMSSTSITNDLLMTTGAQTLNNLTFTSTKNLILGNDLTVAGTYSQTAGVVKLNGHSLTLNGSVTLSGGSFVGTTTSNLLINASSITTSTLNFTTTLTLNNFTLNSPSQTLIMGSNLTVEGAFTQTSGTININGNTLTLDVASTATFPTSASNGVFTGSSSSGLSISSTSITNSLFMDQTTLGTTNELSAFTLNSSGQTLTLGNSLSCVAFTQTAGIIALNGQTLSITGATIFPAASTNGTISGSSTSNLSISSTAFTNDLFMTTGSQTLNNFTLNTSTTTKVLILGTDLTVNGTFTHTKGIINLNGNTLTLGGTAVLPSPTTNGSFVGSTTSNLLVNASSITTNTLTFSTTLALNNFTLNSSAQTLVMGSALTVSGAFTQTTGTLSLNGKTLTLSGTATFPASSAGAITGSATSGLSISTTSITNSLFMDQTTPGTTNKLSAFTLNSSGQTLTLGNSLTCAAFTQTAGIIALNGQTLSITGATIFPAASTNGTISGSSTSNLSISSTAFTNDLFMTTGSQTLNNFTLNTSTTTKVLILGTDLTVNGTFTHTKGIINLNGNTLTLGGSVVLPSPTTNGSFVGSTTSNLLINASSITTNTLTFSTTLALNNFTLNSSAQTLVMGSALTVSGAFTQTTGTLSLNGKTLTLSGTATFPASSAGAITGSATSGLSISTTSITNSLFMDQTTPGTTNKLSAFTLNSSGQTLTLGNSLTCAAFTQTAGIIALNGQTLSITGATTFPAASTNGTISGSSASNLSIAATTITNDLFMTTGSQTLNNFTLNTTTAARVLVLGSSLIVNGAFTHTKGILNLNGNTLTLGGSVVLPSPTTNGSFVGSTTSNLLINASSITTNTLTFSTTLALNNFTLNSSAQTLKLGSALTVSGAFTQTTGTLNLNGNTLTLTGTATFPTSASNGVFTGSSTSGLSISTTSITNSLFMDQTTAGTTNQLSAFTLNSSGQTLKMGNSFLVSGAYTHTNGNINLNNNILALSGVITLPAALSNGYYTGSSSSSIFISGSGAITNSLFLDQTTTGSTNALSTLALNRIGQTLTLGNALSVIDSICPQSGTLSIGSNVTLVADVVNVGHTGRIGKVGGTLSATSIASHVYHAPPSGNKTNWMLMGAAGVSNATFGQWSSCFRVTCPSGCVSNNAGGTAFNSITSYNEATDAFPAISGTTAVISPGVGYWVYMGTSNPGTTSAAIPISISGTPEQGTFSWPTITNTLSDAAGVADGDNGSNLLANPYPSPISWKKVINDPLNSSAISSNPELANIYIYSATYNGGDYLSYNATSGISSPSYGPGANSIIDKIPMGGGFYVWLTSSASKTLQISEGDKVMSGSDSSFLYRQANASIPFISLVASKGSTISEASIAFSPNATLGKDGYDTPSFPWNNTLQVSTVAQGKSYAVDAVPPLTQSYSIPLKIRSGATTQYTITPMYLQNIESGACLILHDNYTGLDYDLRQGAFNLMINDTETVARFVVNITANNIDALGNFQTPSCSASSVTGIKTFSAPQKNMEINRDAGGYYVQFNYQEKTNAVISVQNLLGEKVITDINQENVLTNKTYVSLGNTENKVLIISVVTDAGEKTFRKVINQ